MKVRTLVLGVAVAAGVGVWATQRPANAVVTEPPSVPVAVDEPLADAATAALALAMLAEPACADCDPDVYDAFGLRVARIARGYLVRRPRGFRDDCSGFVSAVFTQAEVPMDHVVATLWDRATANDALHWGDPKVGDLIFFDDTWDRNHNGVWDDPLTHIGLVLDLEPDGTVVFAHSGTSAGRSLGYMNLEQPFVDRTEDGVSKNTWLREPAAWDPVDAGYLTSDLWAAYATVDPDQDWLSGSPGLVP